MRCEVLFTNRKDVNQALQDLTSQAEKLDFEPDLVMVYCTLKYHGKYQKILDGLHEHFGDVPMIGSTADAFVFPHRPQQQSHHS